MNPFKFLSDNKDDGIIGAYNETDLFVPIQLRDRITDCVFTTSYFLLQNMRRKACALYLLPNLADNCVEYQGLFSYQITAVQEIEDRQIRYWAAIWFRSPTGNVLCNHLTETIRP
jgi:hypothetical protein